MKLMCIGTYLRARSSGTHKFALLVLKATATSDTTSLIVRHPPGGRVPRHCCGLSALLGYFATTTSSEPSHPLSCTIVIRDADEPTLTSNNVYWLDGQVSSQPNDY